MKSSTVALLILLLCALPLVGCSSTIRKPQLAHPGPAGFQRDNALQFDPYPPNDVAPPIVGGRPRGFQKPPNEVIRARQQTALAPWRSTPPLPPVVPTPTAPLY